MSQHWARDFWKLFHTICESEHITQPQMMNICQDFSRCLPCSKCRSHFLYLLKTHPITNFETNQHWGFFLHDEVNTSIRKPRFKTNFDGSLILDNKLIPPPPQMFKRGRVIANITPPSIQAAQNRGRF